MSGEANAGHFGVKTDGLKLASEGPVKYFPLGFDPVCVSGCHDGLEINRPFDHSESSTVQPVHAH